MLQEDLYEEFRRLKLIMKLRREMQNIVDPAHAALKVVYWFSVNGNVTTFITNHSSDSNMFSLVMF